jgi:hypothetical protein
VCVVLTTLASTVEPVQRAVLTHPPPKGVPIRQIVSAMLTTLDPTVAIVQRVVPSPPRRRGVPTQPIVSAMLTTLDPTVAIVQRAAPTHPHPKGVSMQRTVCVMTDTRGPTEAPVRCVQRACGARGAWSQGAVLTPTHLPRAVLRPIASAMMDTLDWTVDRVWRVRWARGVRLG